MKTRIHFYCDRCDRHEQDWMNIGEPRESARVCSCGGTLVRKIKTPKIAMEQDEAVRWATQRMINSTMPSGNVKTLI